MGTVAPSSCTDYDAVRADPELARVCAAVFEAQRPDWEQVAEEMPWAKMVMEAIVMFIL